MLEDEIRRLAEQPPERSLDGLETHIWTGVAAREQSAKISRLLIRAQTALLILAVIGSVIAGMRWSSAAQATEFDVFSTRMELSPVMRLLGSQP